MPFKWPFGGKAKGEIDNSDPSLKRHIMLLGELLERLPVKNPDQEQNLRNIWAKPNNRYNKRGNPEYLDYNYRIVAGPVILADLKQELGVPYRCWDDPEARRWARAFESMVTSGRDSYRYRWGAHEMAVEIHRFGPDRYAIVRVKYSDYYV